MTDKSNLQEIAKQVYDGVYGAVQDLDANHRSEMEHDIYITLVLHGQAENYTFTLADVPALIAEHKEYCGIA